MESKHTPESLFQLLAMHGGEIVSTNSLKPDEIAQARASGRMYVDADSLGYAWMPDIKRFPETSEEVEQFEKWFPLPVDFPEHLKDPSFIHKPSPQDINAEMLEALKDCVLELKTHFGHSHCQLPQEGIDMDKIEALIERAEGGNS